MEIARVMFFVVLLAAARARKANVCVDPLRSEVNGEWVDLTHPFDNTTLGYPGLKPFQLEITNQNYTDAGYWLQTEDYGGATHVGTHMDAPCHIVKGQWNLEDIPLDRFMAPAAVVDICHRTAKDRNANLEVRDLLRWENSTGQTLDETIVLVNTGWWEKWSDEKDFLGTDTGNISEVSFPAARARKANVFADPLRSQVNGKLVDLTHPFDDTTMGYPGLKPFQLVLTNRNFTDAGYWLQTEDYGGATHVGSHMDAPCHIVKGQWSLEDIPLDRFMAPAAVVDIRHRTARDRNADLEVRDLLRWEDRTGQTLDETIVLVNSGWSEKWSDVKDFLGTDTGNISEVSFPGISPSAAEWLASHRKIYGIGIDTTSLDSGRAVHRKAHQAFFRANIYGLENVANLGRLPAYGAFLFVCPMRIKGACGSPARIIALIPGVPGGRR